MPIIIRGGKSRATAKRTLIQLTSPKNLVYTAQIFAWR